jgi:septal ring factor EnvC (AmiA/AmiB activator)
MLENLKEVILNLEKSLNMMVQNEEMELLRHPEYLRALKEVVQSINQVTRTLKNLEGSYSEGRERDKEKPAEKEKTSKPADRTLSIVKKKSKNRRASLS